jgi:hypothetical protein
MPFRVVRAEEAVSFPCLMPVPTSGRTCFASACPFRTPEEDLVLMRRKYLLSTAMLSVLLATSACTAGSPVPASSPQPANSSSQPASLAGAGTGNGSLGGPQIGVSQWNAAQAARKAKPRPATAASTESAAKTQPATAAKAKATTAATKAKPAGKAAAATAAAAEKSAAAAAKKAAAKKKAARDAAKTRPGTGALKRTTPVPVAPRTAPAAVRRGSAEQIVRSACTAADTLHGNLVEGSVTIGNPALPAQIAGGTGTSAGAMESFRCLD